MGVYDRYVVSELINSKVKIDFYYQDGYNRGFILKYTDVNINGFADLPENRNKKTINSSAEGGFIH